jgi:hypothetical protein
MPGQPQIPGIINVNASPIVVNAVAPGTPSTLVIQSTENVTLSTTVTVSEMFANLLILPTRPLTVQFFAESLGAGPELTVATVNTDTTGFVLAGGVYSKTITTPPISGALLAPPAPSPGQTYELSVVAKFGPAGIAATAYANGPIVEAFTA